MIPDDELMTLATLVQDHPEAEVLTDLATAQPIEIGLR